ncbi:hypothetical protein RGF97_10360 [Streptomyces roseicoloratus]|uniref:Uncharacterized protein n=1 Tax=Streptomyces roseicoloratus TaxID=2508722 RepID=A0ABY9RSL0_9ACTN|nr:hypothetical protein [Streptomyces roseicoloratus]WMX45177.1 hypothetical protein RGF97_10360 [Streptomyces roseicoloratus]
MRHHHVRLCMPFRRCRCFSPARLLSLLFLLVLVLVLVFLIVLLFLLSLLVLRRVPVRVFLFSYHQSPPGRWWHEEGPFGGIRGLSVG